MKLEKKHLFGGALALMVGGCMQDDFYACGPGKSPAKRAELIAEDAWIEALPPGDTGYSFGDQVQLCTTKDFEAAKNLLREKKTDDYLRLAKAIEVVSFEEGKPKPH